jgi:hypothetical protein
MSLRFVWWHSNHDNEISWMSSCWKNSSTLTCFIDRTVVIWIVLYLFIQTGFEPYHRTLNEKNLRVRFIQHSCLEIPFASFYIGTTDINTIFRRRWVIFLYEFIVIDEFINGNLVFSCIILHRTSQKALSKEELVDPIEWRNTISKPSCEEFKS